MSRKLELHAVPWDMLRTYIGRGYRICGYHSIHGCWMAQAKDMTALELERADAYEADLPPLPPVTH